MLGGSGDHPVSGLLFGAKILLNKRGPNKKMPHVGQGVSISYFSSACSFVTLGFSEPSPDSHFLNPMFS